MSELKRKMNYNVRQRNLYIGEENGIWLDDYCKRQTEKYGFTVTPSNIAQTALVKYREKNDPGYKPNTK
jgi:hypothetical protein